MARKKQTVVYVIVSLLLVVVVVLGIVFMENIKTAFSGQRLYTQEQYEQAYSKGKSDVKSSIAENKNKSENLKTEIANKDILILNKENTWQQLQEEFRNESNRNALLNQEINNTSSSITSLQDLISKYTGIIPDLLNENECIIAYKVNGKIQSSAIVEKGTTLTSAHTAQFDNDCYDNFNYWQVAGVEVNPIGMTITDNIEFEANVTHRYKIWTTIGTSRTSHIIANWSQLETPVNDKSEDIYNNDKFKCWKINNVEVDLVNVVLENNLELVAHFRKRVIFNVDVYLQNLDGSTSLIKNCEQEYYWIEDKVYSPLSPSGSVEIYYEINEKYYKWTKAGLYTDNINDLKCELASRTDKDNFVILTEELSIYRIIVFMSEIRDGIVGL